MADKNEKLTTKGFLVGLGVLADEKMENKRLELIAAIDKQNADRKAKNAEKRAGVDEPIENAIKAVLADGPKFSNEIKVTIDGAEVKTQKIVQVANALVAAGVLTKERAFNEKGNPLNKYALA